MNISDLSSKFGVSRQTIYNRLKRDGIKVDTFRNAKNGEITEFGLLWAEKTFVKDECQMTKKSVKNQTLTKLDSILTEKVDTQQKEIDSLQQKLKAQEEVNRILSSQLEEAKSTIEDLRTDKRFLQETVSRLTLPKLTQAEEQKEEGQKKKRFWEFWK